MFKKSILSVVVFLVVSGLTGCNEEKKADDTQAQPNVATRPHCDMLKISKEHPEWLSLGIDPNTCKPYPGQEK